jgi:hypothetical protein
MEFDKCFEVRYDAAVCRVFLAEFAEDFSKFSEASVSFKFYLEFH